MNKIGIAYQSGSNGLNVSQEQIVGQPSGVTITKTYTYDTLGRKKTETLKRRTSPTNAALLDLTTSYDYDALDRVTKVTDALGNEVVNSYDANGQLWKVTHRYKKPDATFDVREVATKTFDAAERVKTGTDAEGNVTSYAYDESGNLIAVTDAEGHTTRFEYDAMNRRTAVIDATGYRTETSYTLRGDVVGITNANGETVQFEIDALGRKTASIDPMGYRTEYAYDENNNLTCTIDANAVAGLQPKNSSGCTESRQYDELGRVTKITDASNGETAFTYDLTGNRLTVKDAENKTWSFGYNDLGRLASETDHSGKTTTYKPDEAGNVYEKTNRLNEVTRYSFDNANRLTRADYLKDNSWETFGYDPAGNPASAANAGISAIFQFDRLNRLERKIDSRGRSLAFSYDKAGNILTKTTYQDSTTSYTYNAANRLVMLRNPDYLQVDYQYDPAGRLLSRVMSSGARTMVEYDGRGALSRLSQYDAANALISDTNYTRDRVGNILTAVDANGTTTHTYDPLYRLKTADYPGTASDELFTYDLVGNRKTHTRGSLTPNTNTRYYKYATGTNRISEIRIGSISGTLESAFTHDFEGRLTSQTGTNAKTLTWDAKGRVKTLAVSGVTESYTYDTSDHRTGRSGGTLGSLAYYLEGEHLESVYSGATLKEKYFRGSNVDELVAGYLTDTDAKLKPFLYHHDQVNSVSAVSGHNGGTIQKMTYSAFGGILSDTGTSPNRLKYTGREDDGTGLYYYRARYYDPEIGRFISEDPLGFGAGDVNFYAYVQNNPVNGNDPSGKIALPVVTGAIGAGASAIGSSVGQLINNGGFNNFSIKNVGIATGVGFAAGVAAPYTAATWLGAAATGAVSNIVQYGLTQFSDGNSITVQDVALSGVTGFAGGAIGGSVSRSTGLRFSENSYWLDSELAKQLNNNSDILTNLTTASMSRNTLGSITSGIDTSRLFDTGTSFGKSTANGGFVLYPNKPNTNMMQSVYSK